jgi:hypothetical protein
MIKLFDLVLIEINFNGKGLESEKYLKLTFYARK